MALAARARRVALGGVLLLAAAPIGAACASASPLACPPEPIACPSLDGISAFCTWAQWGCPADACGGYYAVVDPTVDSRFTYYYSAATGAYAATVSVPESGGSPSCSNGPSSFTPPSSCSYVFLASCSPPAFDGGVVPIDASFDAGDTGSPPGSPSSQPLALPPP